MNSAAWAQFLFLAMRGQVNLHGWSTHSFSGQPVPVSHRPLNEKSEEFRYHGEPTCTLPAPTSIPLPITFCGAAARSQWSPASACPGSSSSTSMLLNASPLPRKHLALASISEADAGQGYDLIPKSDTPISSSFIKLWVLIDAQKQGKRWQLEGKGQKKSQ